MRNPFEYGRELGLDELVDRTNELDEIEATIRNRAKLFVIGPRRFGKTSLLSAADEAATGRGAVIIRLDAEKYESLELLAAALLSAATSSLRGPAEHAMETVRKFASRLRPQITFDGEVFHVTLGAVPDQSQVAAFTEALDAVDQLAERAGREVAVILDEVQQIVVEHGLIAERQLRSVVQHHRNVAYVFAGSATRLLTEMTSNPNRPFYRLGARLFLGPVPRDDFSQFLHSKFEHTGLVLPDESSASILDLAQDVPYNVQRLAHAVWELAVDQGAEVVDPSIVRTALRRIVLREDPAYTQLWTGLTVNQKKAVKAVIESGGKELFSSSISRSVGIPTSSLQSALQSLERSHVVRTEASLGESRYRLVDPFFAEWIIASQTP